MTFTEFVYIRQLKQGDINFILDSSIQCLSKYTESIFKGWDRSDVVKHIERLIFFVLSGKSPIPYSMFILCDKGDEDTIYAYILADTASNHILLQYTKYTYRKLGLQKLLLLPLVIDESLPVTVNFPTKEMLRLKKDNKVIIIDKLMESLITRIVQS
jgi:hypothetical protein